MIGIKNINNNLILYQIGNFLKIKKVKIMITENWKFYKNGKLRLSMKKYAKNIEQMNAFYEDEKSEKASIGVSIKRGK